MKSQVIRRVRADDWPELRRLRLEALQDSPQAFGSTYEHEVTLGGDAWQRWAAEAAAGETRTVAAAVDGERWVAMAGGVLADGDPSTAYLIAVYVTPSWQGRDVGRLVSAERERGLRRVLLHVADWNQPARRAYEAIGFTSTGATQQLAHDPSVTELEMRLDLVS